MRSIEGAAGAISFEDRPNACLLLSPGAVSRAPHRRSNRILTRRAKHLHNGNIE